MPGLHPCATVRESAARKGTRWHTALQDRHREAASRGARLRTTESLVELSLVDPLQLFHHVHFPAALSESPALLASLVLALSCQQKKEVNITKGPPPGPCRVGKRACHWGLARRGDNTCPSRLRDCCVARDCMCFGHVGRDAVMMRALASERRQHHVRMDARSCVHPHAHKDIDARTHRR